MKKRLLLLLLIGFISRSAYADSTLTSLTNLTSVDLNDTMYIVDATDSGDTASKKVTPSNLFASATDLDTDGVISANAVALATDTTGDFVSDITASTNLTSTGATSGENISHTLSVDDAFLVNDADDTTTFGIWVGDQAYSAVWNANLSVPTKNAVYDKVETKQDTVTDGNALTFTGATLDFDGGASPGGELGGTWASPTVDATHSGSAHHTQSHAITSSSDHTGNNWKLLYLDGAGTPTEVALGDSGTVLKSTGASSAPIMSAESGSGGGAPTDADYLVGTANGSLSAEIVVGTTPGGELGNTWASPTIDDSLAVTSWNLTTPTITTSLTTSTPTTISAAELDRLDGLAGIIVTDATAVTDLEGTGLSITAGTLNASAGAPEGTAVLSTGETGGTKFLREDGDGTSSWQTPAGGGGASTGYDTFRFVIESPVAGDDFDLGENIFLAGTAVRMTVIVDPDDTGDTASISLWTAGDDGDTNALIATVIGDNDSEDTTTFTTSAIASNEHVRAIVNSTGGTVGYVNVTFELSYSVSSAAEINVPIHPQSAKLPTSNPMQIDAGEASWRLLSDDTTQDTAFYSGILDDDYSGGTLYVDFIYSMASDATDNIVVDTRVWAVSPGDAVDFGDTPSYDASNAIQEVTPSTAGYPGIVTVTLTNDDGIAAGDWYQLALSRIPQDAGDTATGNFEIREAVLRE